MQRSLSITRVGLTVSAALAVPYIVIMLTSMLMVGKLTTSSWQAAFLGIGWSAIAGFAIGLLGVVIVGLTIAVVFVPIFNALQRLIVGKPKIVAQANQINSLTTRSWQARLLAGCLVLPALALLALRLVTSAGALGSASGDINVVDQGSGSQMQPVTMGSVINTRFRETEPSFTADGRTMYFNCNSGDICISKLAGTWEQGEWTSPERLKAPINTAFEEVEPVINGAGDKLYFTSIRPGRRLWNISFLSPFINAVRVANSLAVAKLGRSWFGGLGLTKVYVSYWLDGAWSEPIRINDAAGEPPVNSKFADHCLFFSADGNEAFWTSTRPGGFGSDDIWTSRRVGGGWTEPENLGPDVNGPESEHSPIPTPDSRSLYVTTTRAEGFGGEDIYVTTRRASGTWSSLANLGPQINGPGDDRCAAWTPDLRIFLFDSVRASGFGSRDIWWVYFKDVKGYPPAAASTGAAR